MARTLCVISIILLSTPYGTRHLAPIITSQAAVPEVLTVTSALDDGSAGTLRWAIETSNSSPGRYGIVVAPPQPGVIVLRSELPAIRGPVTIAGSRWQQTGEYVAIDGSGYVSNDVSVACPGAVPGQYGANVRTLTNPGLRIVDTSDVEISGLEIRRFCIGILVHRSASVFIHDNRISANRGGAGVMLTGDDGQGNPTGTTTVHNKVLRNEFADNGDGLELTRGAAFNLVADNVFRSTAANPEPSQGIEILRAHDNVVSGNLLEGYSDGLQINWGDRNYIAGNTFRGNTFGLNLTGVGNIIDSNTITGNRVGIAVRPAEPSPIVRLTRNRISGNGQEIRRCNAGGSCDSMAPKGPMSFGVPGSEHAGFVGSRGGGVTPAPATLQHICPEGAPRCQAAPNGGLRPPIVTSARSRGTEIVVSGTIAGAPASRYVIELFGNTDPNRGEAEIFLSESAVYTDRNGVGAFTRRVERPRADRRIYSVTATMTSTEGATSPLGSARQVVQSKPPGH